MYKAGKKNIKRIDNLKVATKQQITITCDQNFKIVKIQIN